MWIIIRGKVYNCTSFLQQHPEGPEILRKEAGGDATEAFDDVIHSEQAKQRLSYLQVGVIEVWYS